MKDQRSVSREEWLAKAKEFSKKKEFEEALAAYERALFLGARQGEHYLSAAACALRINNLSKVDELAEKALKKNTQDVRALTLKAIVHLDRKRPRLALEMLEAAKKIEPNSKAVSIYIEKAKAQAKEEDNKIPFTRKCRRAPVEAHLNYINHFTGTPVSIKVLSLSAGGCLVDSSNLPLDFKFALSIHGEEDPINGWARKLYVQDDKVGIAFANMDQQHLKKIDTKVREFKRS